MGGRVARLVVMMSETHGAPNAMLHTAHQHHAAANPAFLQGAQGPAAFNDSAREAETGPVHEGGWTATQSLEFFRTHGVRGRLLGLRGRHGHELREYVCRTRFLNGSVDDFAHRILAALSCHTV